MALLLRSPFHDTCRVLFASDSSRTLLSCNSSRVLSSTPQPFLLPTDRDGAIPFNSCLNGWHHCQPSLEGRATVYEVWHMGKHGAHRHSAWGNIAHEGVRKNLAHAIFPEKQLSIRFTNAQISVPLACRSIMFYLPSLWIMMPKMAFGLKSSSYTVCLSSLLFPTSKLAQQPKRCPDGV